MLYVEALAKIETPTAHRGAGRGVVEDPVEEVRLTCLDHLEKTKSPEVVGYFVGKLKDKDNHLVNRAGVALARMKDPTATGPLIDALVTTHKFKLGARRSGEHVGDFQ